MFKTYPRKIHVFCKTAQPSPLWAYAWSTNAYRTCRDAVAGAEKLHPGQTFKANFAKD